MTDPFTAAASLSQVITGFIGIKEQLKDAELKLVMAEHIDRLQSFGMTNLMLVEKNSELQAKALQLTKELTQTKEKLEEKGKYRLKKTTHGKLIYVLNTEAISDKRPTEQMTECKHAVCPDCFKKDRIRILQIIRRSYSMAQGTYALLKCKCKSEFRIEDDEIETIYD